MSVYNQVGTGGYRERFKANQKNSIMRKFEKSDGFVECFVNRNNETFIDKYPMHIFTTRSDGERKFVSHPDFSIQKGDVIEYPDDGKKYIVVEQDTHSGVSDFGKIYRMDSSISFKDSKSNIYTIFYHMTNSGVGNQDSNRTLPISETKKQIWVQFNDVTKTLYENQRFILGNFKAYKVTALDNFSLKGILKITLESDQLLSEDDLVNNIAYNEIQVNTIPETGKNGVFFTKDSLDISIGNTDSVEVYEYSNDVIVPSTTFSFRIDTIDPSKYEIVSEDDNSINIKSLGYYYVGTLVAIKNSDLSEYTIPLTLSSVFG